MIRNSCPTHYITYIAKSSFSLSITRRGYLAICSYIYTRTCKRFFVLPFANQSPSLVYIQKSSIMAGIDFSCEDSFKLVSLKAYLAEFISTLLFVFAGVGSAIAFGLFSISQSAPCATYRYYNHLTNQTDVLHSSYQNI